MNITGMVVSVQLSDLNLAFSWIYRAGEVYERYWSLLRQDGGCKKEEIETAISSVEETLMFSEDLPCGFLSTAKISCVTTRLQELARDLEARRRLAYLDDVAEKAGG